MPARRTALFDEHLALGADMQAYAWAGMALPWSYASSLAQEQRAVREHAGLADVSQLQVLAVRGPGAIACLERLVPRRIADMPVGSSRFSVVLSRFGRICDEAIVMRLGTDEFWISHGCGATRTQLAKLVDGGAATEVTTTPHDDLHVLSVQGPASLRIMAQLADVDLGALPFGGHQSLCLGGHTVRISRSGFTGELGFEIFCAGASVVSLWRLLQKTGAPLGLLPYAYRCVDLLRIEAGFLLYPADLAQVSSLWEAGLGWLVRDRATAYVGHESVVQAKAAAGRRFAGLRVKGAADITRGTSVRTGPCEIGVVTSSAFSPAAEQTLCIALVEEHAMQTGACVQVGPWAGRLVALPFRERKR